VFIDTGATGEGTCFGSLRLAYYISQTQDLSIVFFLILRYTSRYQIIILRAIITYQILSRLQVNDHIILSNPILIVKDLAYNLIIGKSWINLYRVILDITSDKIKFTPRFY
jgi:hypothetical protein